MLFTCYEWGNDPREIAQDVDLIIVGITPSGTGLLHDGHDTTVFNMLRAVSSSTVVTGLIHVDDREFNLQRDQKLSSEEVTMVTEQQIRERIAAVAAYEVEIDVANFA